MGTSLVVRWLRLHASKAGGTAQSLDWELRASQEVLVIKNPPANAGDLRDVGLITGLGRSPGEGHGNPLQYSYPWTEEPDRLQSIESQGVRWNWSKLAHALGAKIPHALQCGQIFFLMTKYAIFP